MTARFALRSRALGTCALLLIVVALTPPARALVQQEGKLPTSAAAAEELLATGQTRQVDRIPDVVRIEHWRVLNPRYVLLNVDSQRSYLLTLAQHCHQLNWAQSVDVSRSGTAIWAGFDYLDADGWRCPIDEIHAL